MLGQEGFTKLPLSIVLSSLWSGSSFLQFFFAQLELINHSKEFSCYVTQSELLQK